MNLVTPRSSDVKGGDGVNDDGRCQHENLRKIQRRFHETSSVRVHVSYHIFVLRINAFRNLIAASRLTRSSLHRPSCTRRCCSLCVSEEDIGKSEYEGHHCVWSAAHAPKRPRRQLADHERGRCGQRHFLRIRVCTIYIHPCEHIARLLLCSDNDLGPPIIRARQLRAIVRHRNVGGQRAARGRQRSPRTDVAVAVADPVRSAPGRQNWRRGDRRGHRRSHRRGHRRGYGSNRRGHGGGSGRW